MRNNKMKKLILTVLLTVFVCVSVFSLTACRVDEIYDNDELIMKTADSSKASSYSCSSLDRESYKVKAKSLTGKKTILNRQLSENQKIYIDLTVNGGRFKVVLITSEGVKVLAENTFKGEVAANVSAGKYRITAVGDEANFTLELKLL